MAGTPVEQVKEKLDIVQFLREFLPLTPAGKNFKANCPFHKEKTPSFMVSPERQSWHCFGCGLGGDVFSFLMRHENVEFGEALRILAEKAGVELRRVNPAEYKFAGLLHDINAAAKNFFVEQLKASVAAQKYLTARGLKQGIVNEFELGFAPNDSETLTMYLMKQKFAPDDIVRAGLAIQAEQGRRFDRFRGRIMFPIHDHFGKCVGFTGRILPQFDTGEMGKYVNSPETPIFNKSKLLYGFHITKTHIREAGWAFLVEGQMDLLMSYQSGVKNVAASSGTALTADHLRVLRRQTDQLKIAFDADEAGVEAAERAIDLADAADFSVKIVRFGTYKDPAEAAEAGPEVLKDAIKAAVPAPEFYFEKYLPSGALAKDGLPRFDRRDRTFLLAVRAVLLKLKALTSPIERDHWLKELGKRLGIEERVLLEEMSRIEMRPQPVRGAAGEAPAAEPERRPATRRDLVSERLVSACLAKNDFTLLGEHAAYLTSEHRTILDLFAKNERRAADTALDELMNLVILRQEDLPEGEIVVLKRHLYEEYIRARRRELAVTVNRTETAGDVAAHEAALAELQGLPAL